MKMQRVGVAATRVPQAAGLRVSAGAGAGWGAGVGGQRVSGRGWVLRVGGAGKMMNGRLELPSRPRPAGGAGSPTKWGRRSAEGRGSGARARVGNEPGGGSREVQDLLTCATWSQQKEGGGGRRRPASARLPWPSLGAPSPAAPASAPKPEHSGRSGGRRSRAATPLSPCGAHARVSGGQGPRC